MSESEERYYTKREPVTVSVTVDGNSMTVTQEYSEMFDSGHYKYVIFDENGDIIGANQTMAGAPKGKVDEKFVDELLKAFIRELNRFG